MKVELFSVIADAPDRLPPHSFFVAVKEPVARSKLSAVLCLLSASLAVSGGVSAADGQAGVGGPLVPDVRRVILPERLSRGNTGVEPLSPIDRAAWLAPADAAIPPGGLFLRFDGGRVAGTVTLPEGLPGVFAWQGVETPLSPGENRIAR